MRCYQYVNTQIELLVADQQRVVDVSLHDIRFGLVTALGPVTDFVYVSKQKNSFSLTSADLSYKIITGFMIQTAFYLSLFRLNSSKKIGYQLGKRQVNGRKLYVAAYYCLPYFYKVFLNRLTFFDNRSFLQIS